MTFSQALCHYMDLYSITLTRLAERSGISKSTLSRLRSGKKEPMRDDVLPRCLALALAELGREQGEETSAEEICAALRDTLNEESSDRHALAANLNALIDTLEINVNDLSRHLRFDPSYLSRIRSRQRHPANIPAFCTGVASFVIARASQRDLSVLARLIGRADLPDLDAWEQENALAHWLTKQSLRPDSATRHFLEAMDAFDPKAAPAVPALPSPPPGGQEPPLSADYYDLEGFMGSELMWMDYTARCGGSGELLFYSDMPMAEMASIPGFAQRWILSLSSLLQKGFRLRIIHDIDRPLPEMLMGLEGWIPLYMTGLVSPYCLRERRDGVFCHFLRVSPVAALSGEAIALHHAEGRYRFTRDSGELSYYRARGEALLSHARALMEIYPRHNAEDLADFLRSFDNGSGSFRNILPAPPVYTMSGELLEGMLERRHVGEAERQRILRYWEESRVRFKQRLAAASVTDMIPLLSPEGFQHSPPTLFLADLFPESDLPYTPEEYSEHLRLTRETMDAYSAYRCVALPAPPFRQISIRIREDECALISHGMVPAIHFVIRTPKLRRAIEQFAAATEEQSVPFPDCS